MNASSGARPEQSEEQRESIADFAPSMEHITLLSRRLGMHPEEDAQLMYIAQEALSHPPPEPWIDGLNASGRIVYKNQETNQETEQHPLEDKLRRRFQHEKAQLMINQSHVQAQQVLEAFIGQASEKAREVRQQAELQAAAKEAQLLGELQELKKGQKLELAQLGQQQKDQFQGDLVQKLSAKHKEKMEKLERANQKRLQEVGEELRRQVREEARQRERQTEAAVRAERDNLETINKLDMEALKIEFESKKQHEMQKIRLKVEESTPTSQVESEKQAYQEFQSFKSRVENDLEDARLKMDESNSGQLRELRTQLRRERDRQTQLLESRLETRLKEAQFERAKQRRETEMARQKLKDDAFEAMERQLRSQKQALLYEHDAKMREAKIQHENTALAKRQETQFRKEGEYLQRENKAFQKFHAESGRKRFECCQKYEQEQKRVLKGKCEALETEQRKTIAKLRAELQSESKSLSSQSELVREIEALTRHKQTLKRRQTELEADLDYQLIQVNRQKILLEKQRGLTLGSGQSMLKKSQKELELQVKALDQALEELSERRKQLSLQPNFKPLPTFYKLSSEEEEEIFQIKAMLTQLLKHQQSAPTQQLKQDQLQELDKTIDEQIAGIESSLWKLEKERDEIKKLARTYKQDVVKEVEQATRELDYKRGGQLALMHADMQQTLQSLLKDQTQIEEQIERIRDSKKALLDIRKQAHRPDYLSKAVRPVDLSTYFVDPAQLSRVRPTHSIIAAYRKKYSGTVGRVR